jgi:hypothetical protein
MTGVLPDVVHPRIPVGRNDRPENQSQAFTEHDLPRREVGRGQRRSHQLTHRSA